METSAGPTVVGGVGKTPVFIIIIACFIMIILQIVDITSNGGGGDDDSSSSKATTAVAKTKNTGDVFVIGVDGEWPPYCHRRIEDIPNDNRGMKQAVPEGFLMDIAVEACRRGNLNCKFPVYGKWDECFEPSGRIGQSLLNDHFDMCLCWTVTPGRLGTTIWPNNDNRGWTLPAEGGLLVKDKFFVDAAGNGAGSRQYHRGGTTVWSWLNMQWRDGCNGDSMSKELDSSGNVVTDSNGRPRWVQNCDDNGENCMACPEGKIRVGYISGWALKPESFDWVQVNGATPDKSRIEWFDEHDADATTKLTYTDYAHLAKALEDEVIDAAYTYTNAVDAHLETPCTICTNPDLWRSLVYRHSGMWFSAGGASGFYKFGNEAKRDLMDTYANQVIDDKPTYCTICNGYWKQEDSCNTHCIGCRQAGLCVNIVTG